MKEVRCCVSGSFKFKPHIDQVITLFEGVEFKVLSPVKGGLFYPDSDDFFWTPGSYPLVTERRMSEMQAKGSHIEEIKRSNFTYFITDDSGYIGKDSAREARVGAKVGPIYASGRVNPNLDLGADWAKFTENFEIRTPEQVVARWKYIFEKTRNLWLPTAFLLEKYEMEQVKSA